MGYKYERWITHLIELRLATEEGIDHIEETKSRDELKEVYAKAKAFNETVLVDKRYLEEQKRKAKAFNEIVEVFKDYPLKTDSDVMDFIQAKLDDMEDK
ncbi:hypothetical protein ACI6CX_01470 [Mammaliicoccus sciuri]|uniref:hypothetical protein n=1 Tax=Mammaliicoccus sciuri TaxID=1296 RepID=UPI0038519FF4